MFRRRWWRRWRLPASAVRYWPPLSCVLPSVRFFLISMDSSRFSKQTFSRVSVGSLIALYIIATAQYYLRVNLRAVILPTIAYKQLRRQRLRKTILAIAHRCLQQSTCALSFLIISAIVFNSGCAPARWCVPIKHWFCGWSVQQMIYRFFKYRHSMI